MKLNFVTITVIVLFVLFSIPSHAVNLSNYSVRAYVKSGEGVAIEGFVIENNAHKILLRVKGPSLSSSLGKRLVDPVMFIYKDELIIGENDDWNISPFSEEIAQSGFAPADSREPAIIGVFEPGLYTVVVSGKNGDDGIGLLEIFDMGEVSRLYDDFSGGSLDLMLWSVIAGNPAVKDGYLYCLSEEFINKVGSYFCKISSTETSSLWGIAVENIYHDNNVTLGMQMCPGMIGSSRLCGTIEINSDGSIWAKVHKEEPDRMIREIIFEEMVYRVDKGLFLAIGWDHRNRNFNFLFKSDKSSSVHAVKWFGNNNIEDVMKKAPLEIYSLSIDPVKSIFPIAYVER